MSLEKELAAKLAGPLKSLHIVAHDDNFMVAFMMHVDTALNTNMIAVGTYLHGTGIYTTKRGDLIELPMSRDTWKDKVSFHWDK